jgi:hypothetical protein
MLLGLLAGAIAKFPLPGDDPGGMIGIAGALVGGFIGSALHIGRLGHFFGPGHLAAGDRGLAAAFDPQSGGRGTRPSPWVRLVASLPPCREC